MTGNIKQVRVNTAADLQNLLRVHHKLPDKRLGDILLEAQIISREQLDAVLALQKKQGSKPLGQILIEKSMVKPEHVNAALVTKLGIPSLQLEHYSIPPDIVTRLPGQVAMQYNVIPLCEFEGNLIVAMENPLDHAIISELRFYTKTNIEGVMAPSKDITALTQKYYSGADESEAMEDLQLDAGGSSRDVQESAHLIEQEAQRKPIVRLLNSILLQAVSEGASDINIRPEKSRVNVYYRIDGQLQFSRTINKSLLPALVSRVKITAQMDIAERRLPQDGHARMVWGQNSIDLRISVVPTVNGESVVIRILDTNAGLRQIDELGFQERELALIKRIITRPSGLFLVTGPTGSGKSTTLYALLNEVRKSSVHILTVEDPVEYDMEGIEQVQISVIKGYTFAQALRHFLRHDPDVIMVGEIRDEETARIANKAALTGHVVFSTLHTNDAASTVTRLLDMGIEPYLLGSTLLGVMAQRLVRINCEHCLDEDEVDPYIRKAMGLKDDEVFYRGKGCDACNQSGYRGRATVCELLAVTPEITDLINKGAPALEINRAAIEQGMTPLGENALNLARKGRTSVEEVFGVRLDF